MVPFSICLMTGTLERRFDRLIGYVNHMNMGAFDGLIQHGISDVSLITNPMWAGKLVPYCGFRELDRAVAEADFVITHAGIGSIIMSAKHNKPMIVVPRLKAHNEHFDDHQLQISQYIKSHQGVYIATDDATFLQAFRAIRSLPSRTSDLIGGEKLKDYVLNLHKAS